MTDANSYTAMPWVLFFNGLYNGDIGTDFTPTFENLTTTGTPTFSGRYIKLTQQLVYFRIDITPNGGTSTSTAGSTKASFPIPFSNNGICFAVSGLAGSTAGMVNKADNKIYVPSWTAVSVGLTIIGIVEVQ